MMKMKKIDASMIERRSAADLLFQSTVERPA
jgi:hypothetical protein